MSSLSYSARIWLTLSYSQQHDASIAQEDHGARFYEDYRKVAEEYDIDIEFLKKHEEGLDTTRIFVSPTESFFLVLANRPIKPFCFLLSPLRPFKSALSFSPTRVMRPSPFSASSFTRLTIKLLEMTYLPSHNAFAIFQVQAIMYANLHASLLSAFLEMLGKQWIDRYASTGMRGSAIERSQSRQRKPVGVGFIIESPPVMLQVALSHVTLGDQYHHRISCSQRHLVRPVSPIKTTFLTATESRP